MSQPRSKSSFQLGTPWHVKSLTCVFSKKWIPTHNSLTPPSTFFEKKTDVLFWVSTVFFCPTFKPYTAPPVPRISDQTRFPQSRSPLSPSKIFLYSLAASQQEQLLPRNTCTLLGSRETQSQLSAGWENAILNRGPWMVYKTWILNQIHWEFLTSSVRDDDWSN